jgi:8-oxo-dGTP diphosphatase
MRSDKVSMEEVFGNHLRVRVCGILVEEGSILLVKHKYIGQEGILWAPPGGGMMFNQSAGDNLKREFLEETGLYIEVGEFLFVNEYLHSPMHAVELFFRVEKRGGKLMTGSDPELGKKSQIIETVKFLNYEELKRLHRDHLHNIFHIEKNPSKIIKLRGFYHFYDL